MKIQDLLPQYLYQQKNLSVPGLGVFELNPSVNVYEIKEEGWPENTITFKQDKNAALSEDFLSYLVQNTGKMKPLAISDLESYISSGVQLLNIGKPFMLKGIGSVTKSAFGDLNFQQGSPVLDKIDGAQPEQVKDRTLQHNEDNEMDFSHEAKKSSKKAILIFGSIIALALIGWAVYLAIPKLKTSEPDTTEETVSTDTITNTNTAVDTTASIKPDSVTVAAPVPAAADTSSFELVIDRVATKEKADARLAYQKTVKNRDLTIVQKDSSTYQLVLRVMKPLSDTSHVIDSLKSFYHIRATLLKRTN
ncbi:MAG: hypothetical protein QM725_07930 [Lacibacter sp.]